MDSAGKIGRLLAIFAIAGIVGCSPLRPKAHSPLQAAQMSPDSVTLDVFFVRCPLGDPVANLDLWQQIDEQQIPVETRRRLSANGFRAGVVAGQIPIALSQLLELKENSVPASNNQAKPITEIGSEEGPMWSHKQLRPHKRSEIVTSEIYPQLPVLLSGSDGVTGKTYQQAQGVLAVSAVPEKDGRVSLEVIPELHYGHEQRNFTASQGGWRIEPGRPRLAFDDMVIAATLAPGQMIVLSCLPNLEGSLGHNFLTTDSSGCLEQKLLVIRLSQTQHDELFEPVPISLDQVP